ncbi:hypothetical protein DFJ43DRAFT_1105990 [Lentinula guzmanii]|uniref:Uncharacterized protein n=1 Tax=Lentinula guzmanii TaxID=2804957 RepID=A0AA38MUU9_9AGAR|nr:hypothetical protein DFJ43DRAFT_1105990 [Lentinula guzmanii]
MRFNIALLILGLTSFAAALPISESNPSPEPHSPAAAHVTDGVSILCWLLSLPLLSPWSFRKHLHNLTDN